MFVGNKIDHTLRTINKSILEINQSQANLGSTKKKKKAEMAACVLPDQTQHPMILNSALCI